MIKSSSYAHFLYFDVVLLGIEIELYKNDANSVNSNHIN